MSQGHLDIHPIGNTNVPPKTFDIWKMSGAHFKCILKCAWKHFEMSARFPVPYANVQGTFAKCPRAHPECPKDILNTSRCPEWNGIGASQPAPRLTPKPVSPPSRGRLNADGMLCGGGVGGTCHGRGRGLGERPGVAAA